MHDGQVSCVFLSSMLVGSQHCLYSKVSRTLLKKPQIVIYPDYLYIFQGRNSLLLPGVSRDARRPSLLCVLEQHARRQSTLSLLSADYGLGNPSRRLSASSKALLLQGELCPLWLLLEIWFKKSDTNKSQFQTPTSKSSEKLKALLLMVS